MSKRVFYQVAHSNVQDAFLDSFVESGEFVTLVDSTGRYFHGCIRSHDKLSLLLGARNPLKPMTLFNKRELTLIVPQNAVHPADDRKYEGGAKKASPRKKKEKVVIKRKTSPTKQRGSTHHEPKS